MSWRASRIFISNIPVSILASLLTYLTMSKAGLIVLMLKMPPAAAMQGISGGITSSRAFFFGV